MTTPLSNTPCRSNTPGVCPSWAGFSFLFTVIATLFFLASAASAANGNWQTGDGGYIEGRLISSVDASGTLSDIPVGLELKIKPGWKTYWRAPGDAGLPPRLDWTGSSNLAETTVSYPKPKRFTLLGIQTYGYSNQVVLPITARLTKPGEATQLKANLELLVCEKICVPQTLALSLDVPAGAMTANTATSQLINRFQNAVPTTAETPDLTITSVTEIEKDGTPTLEVAIQSIAPLRQPDVIAEFTPHVALQSPTIDLSADRLSAVLTLPLAAPLPAGQHLAEQNVVLTLSDGDRAIERSTKILVGEGPNLLSGLAGQFRIILLALLGGFILNFMPCVLPVLSIKLLSFVNHRDATPTRIRTSFLATAAGIIFSMLVIAAGLILLRYSGQTVGWGIQFQQPVFIVAMAIIVTLFASNLFGFFEIVLPSRLSNWAGQASNAEQGVAGEFTAGAFATLLATPCSAPFIGTAVGFALTGGTAQILTVFASLGVGLALPYIAIAIWPRAVRIMPKPGAWMETLRKILGLAMAATAIWLLYVLAGQVTIFWVGVIAALLIAIMAALALHKPLANKLGTQTATAAVIALAAVTMGLSPLLKTQRSTSAPSEFAANITWQAFDRDTIKSLVAQGKTVFVDVTADWCITCKTNKSFAIETKHVSERMETGIIAMRADWTLPDDEISAFLASHGRFGIPFNIAYGPAKPRGVVLPELLTPDMVVNALDTARGITASSQTP